MSNAGMPANTRLCGRCGGPGLIVDKKPINPKFIECPVCGGSGVIVAWGSLKEALEELLRGE
jgi:DnaJ-class molecular chaperone